MQGTDANENSDGSPGKIDETVKEEEEATAEYSNGSTKAVQQGQLSYPTEDIESLGQCTAIFAHNDGFRQVDTPTSRDGKLGRSIRDAGSSVGCNDDEAYRWKCREGGSRRSLPIHQYSSPTIPLDNHQLEQAMPSKLYTLPSDCVSAGPRRLRELGGVSSDHVGPSPSWPAFHEAIRKSQVDFSRPSPSAPWHDVDRREDRSSFCYSVDKGKFVTDATQGRISHDPCAVRFQDLPKERGQRSCCAEMDLEVTKGEPRRGLEDKSQRTGRDALYPAINDTQRRLHIMRETRLQTVASHFVHGFAEPWLKDIATNPQAHRNPEERIGKYRMLEDLRSLRQSLEFEL